MVRVVSRHGIANWRTLEQKIADAGPLDQRIDPHILTRVRHALQEEGVIHRQEVNGVPWYSHRDASPTFKERRLQEQIPVYQALQHENFKKRLGATLEIAVYRTLCAQEALPDFLGHFLGHFLDLDSHDDSRLYTKEEPPRRLGQREIGGDRRLDFLVRHPEAGWAGLEIKNIREWLYPDRTEVKELLSKCVSLDIVPVLIARRIHFSTFTVLNACGVVIHQTFNQLFPLADTELATKAKDKDNLGYHDVRTGDQPDARLTAFISRHLPEALPSHREKFIVYKDLLGAFASNEMAYAEFAARVRRRRDGTNEDHDWDDQNPDYE